MSMSLFFKAVTPQDMAVLLRQPSFIDAWIENDTHAVLATDIGTAWSVLNHLLAGVGIDSDCFIDDVLFNGCSIIAADVVQKYAVQLAAWSSAQLLEQFNQLQPEDDFYHLDCFREEPQNLIIEFHKLVAFYQDAAAQQLAVIHYAA